jgi:putative protease
MELLAPAGNMDKLRYAWLYGADAVYIGLRNFSLRTRADNFSPDDGAEIARIKGDKKLYVAMNIVFHNEDLNRLAEELDALEKIPFDALIISDPGAIAPIRKKFPSAALHLSTQANCISHETARFWRDIGFKRIILGREATLEDIRVIRDRVPGVELEAFAHGAMCLAYSGRCFLSRWMADRSGNSGHCAHSCRWSYRYLEEKERPGEYYPVIEGENWTTILSSRDICMIDHLDAMAAAGLDSIKIEGRMKSLYYTAVVTRAYRKGLDLLSGIPVPEFRAFRDELYKVSHREFSTGFFFGKEQVELPTDKSYTRDYLLLGVLGPETAPGRFRLDPMNKIRAGETLELIGPDVPWVEVSRFTLYNVEGEPVEAADHGREYLFVTDAPVKEGFIIRKRDTDHDKKSETGPGALLP